MADLYRFENIMEKDYTAMADVLKMLLVVDLVENGSDYDKSKAKDILIKTATSALSYALYDKTNAEKRVLELESELDKLRNTKGYAHQGDEPEGVADVSA